MGVLKFNKTIYNKVSLIKAAYNYTDKAYIHLDADDEYYYVFIEEKDGCKIVELDFKNEILAQEARHEIYTQTKNIRELLLARSLSSSIITEYEETDDINETDIYEEKEILKDWFDNND